MTSYGPKESQNGPRNPPAGSASEDFHPARPGGTLAVQMQRFWPRGKIVAREYYAGRIDLTRTWMFGLSAFVTSFAAGG